MSAVNIYLRADRIEVWSDGALYDQDGTLMGATHKVASLPHLRCAVAVRGPALAVPLLEHHLGREFATFDALVAGLAGAVRRVEAMHAAVFGLCSHGPRYEVFVAGWSEERGQPESYRVCSDALDDVQALPALLMTPADERLVQQLRAEFPGGSDAEIGPEVWRRLMELQRELRIEQVPGGAEICGVGCFCVLTTITPARTTTEIIRRWPDQVGHKMGVAA